MKKVFCIGELLIDFVAEKQGNDLSKADTFTKKAGGAPANVACAISKLGGNSAFIGAVGSDPFGAFLSNVLKDLKVDIAYLQLSETFTTLAFVSIAEDGERDFVFSRGADRELMYNGKLKELLANSILHFGAATSFLGGPLETTYSQYFSDAIEKEAFISFDPNFRGDLWKGEENAFVKKCIPFIEKSHLCKFSKEEAELISGKKELHDACNFFHDLGVKIVTITLGGEGTLLSTTTLKKVVPSIKVKPVDTTGAGDAFIGCLLYQIANIKNIQQIFEDEKLLINMVKMANKAGAITTTNYGAIPSLPELNNL